MYPINPKTNGKRKLIVSGKKDIKSLLKNEFKKTINILNATRIVPVYK